MSGLVTGEIRNILKAKSIKIIKNLSQGTLLKEVKRFAYVLTDYRSKCLDYQAEVSK